MTTDKNAPATETADNGGIEQIPATVVQVTQPAAVVDARDALLRAIGREAEHVAANNPGHASPALEALARAYTLVTSGTVIPSTTDRNPVAVSGRNFDFVGPAVTDPLLGSGVTIGVR
ncbi:hypothetical protein [Kitasatospora sp. NPDC056273]|uniref:hypothetical protein n=1 Tax=Kitasatospora sp. NPDC056273 TaxID=3345769 RepID=UPI0035E1762A